MKLTIETLKKLIKEEISNMLRESYSFVGTPEDVASELMNKHESGIEQGFLRLVLIDLNGARGYGMDSYFNDLSREEPTFWLNFSYAAAGAANLDEDPSYEIAVALLRSEEGQDIIKKAEVLIAIKGLEYEGRLEELLKGMEPYEMKNFMELLYSGVRAPDQINQVLFLFSSLYDDQQIQGILDGLGYKRNK